MHRFRVEMLQVQAWSTVKARAMARRSEKQAGLGGEERRILCHGAEGHNKGPGCIRGLILDVLGNSLGALSRSVT